MNHLTLGDFVDVVSKSGSPKATKVKEIKHRPPYSPATDFYKGLREGIVETHQAGKSKANLHLIAHLASARKQANYQAAIAGYKKWWGTKTFKWFNPPTAIYAKHGFEISVNPELGLEFNGTPHIIKLYLKDEQLSKLRIDVITALMSATLLSSGLTAPASSPVVGVLDVRQSKLFPGSPTWTSTMPIVDAELAYIAALWPTL